MADLYPVPANGYAGIDANLWPFEVNEKIFETFIQLSDLKPFMGSSMTSPILVERVQQGRGFSHRFPKLSLLSLNAFVQGLDQRSGAEQMQSVTYDEVKINANAAGLKMPGIRVLEYGTPVFKATKERMAEQLVKLFTRKLNYDLFSAWTVYQYPNLIPYLDGDGNVVNNGLANMNVADTGPSYDRIVMAGLTPTAAQYYANATFPTAFNAVAAGAAANGLSIAHLNQLRLYATKGGSAPMRENVIQPADITTEHGFYNNRYIYLVHPECMISLEQDPSFRSAFTDRGTVISKDQPNLGSGALYRGEVKGISIYECQELTKYEFLSANGNHRVAWNLFLGAGSMGLLWGYNPWFAEKLDTQDGIITYFGEEMRGQKCLKFPSKQNALNAAANLATKVEQGVIHSFCALS